MAERNKILIVTTFPYPHQGGLSSHIDLLKKGYELYDIDCKVLSLTDLSSTERLLRKMAAMPFYLFNKGLTFYVLQVLTCFFLRLKIKKLRKDYDILHFHEASLLVKKDKHFRIVLTIHADFTNMAVGDGLFEENSRTATRFYKIEKEAYRNATLIIAVDERIKEYIKKTSGRSDVIKQINFVDTAEFEMPLTFSKSEIRLKYNIPDKKIILCPRRLVSKNGVIYPVQLLTKLTEDFIVIYLGDGPEYSAIVEYASVNGLSDRVFFFKSIYREDMKYFYWLAEYVIIPSVTVANGMQEATSIAAIEGMASGKIVLASAIGGLKELLHTGSNGFLFEEKEVGKIVDKICELEVDLSEKLRIEKVAQAYAKSELDYKPAVSRVISLVTAN